MTSPKCCVIGGAGFIGTALVRMLAASGRGVLAMGRSARPTTYLGDGVTYVAGDYGDRHTLKDVLVGAAEVIDLAYATAPQTSFADPILDVISNVPPTVGLLQEALAARVQKVLLISSGGTVYGPARTLPIDEEHLTQPISPYGITKLAIENYARMFHALFDLPTIVVRPANAYGAGSRKLSGQGFISTAVQRVIEGSDVEIFGQDGTVRDYIHVMDVCAGILAALEKGRPGGIYNVGTGIGTSNVEVLKIIGSLATEAGLPVRIRVLPERKFDVRVNYLDSTRLWNASGWRPTISLASGIAALWRDTISHVRNSE